MASSFQRAKSALKRLLGKDRISKGITFRIGKDIRRGAVQSQSQEESLMAEILEGNPSTVQEATTWETLNPSDTERFLHLRSILYVSSSHVEAAQYDFENKEMRVSYLEDGIWAYEGVSEGEALSFVKAHSKGGWIWSNFRIRGTKHGHRKVYRRVYGWL